MPENGVVQIPHEEILTYDEITRISRCMTGLGIRKIKLTGGEPLIRKNCATLVRMLKELQSGYFKCSRVCKGNQERKSGSGAGGNPGGITVSADWIED